MVGNQLMKPADLDPGPVHHALTDHCIARLAVHLDMQEGANDEHKRAATAISTIFIFLVQQL